MTFFYLAFPIAIVVCAACCFWYGLRQAQQVLWKFLIAGFVFFALICGWFIFLTSSGGGALAFIEFLYASAAAIVSGIFLFMFLSGRRKIIAGIVSILFPLLFFLSIQIGFHYSPTSRIQENGKAVVQALNRYYSDNGSYPKELRKLVPNYIEDLREPATIWGWLYVSEDDEFSLGYVFYVDKLGYSVCIYRSSMPEWDVLHNSTGPFKLAPTPMP
jgi:hypothetical protein